MNKYNEKPDNNTHEDSYKDYLNESSLSISDFKSQFNITENGLNQIDVESKVKKYGLNIINSKKPKPWYDYFLDSLFSPFNKILLCIVLVLFYTDVYLPDSPSYANIVVILILVLTSSILEFFQEYRSNRAAEKLKNLVATTTTVIRDGKKVSIPIANVTIGDLVVLSSGSMVPADIRIISSKDLFVGQSQLTGESDSVKKNSILQKNKDDINSITDFDNICFMGTNVLSGLATGVVIKLADYTYFGKIAHTLDSKPKTAFQKSIEDISRLLIRFMLVMVPLVFSLNIFKHDLILAFTFAVAIAIGITPLLLPVILSSTLSKSALKMASKKTIVKSLDSIQSFGAMNILCTDKTGTLTKDSIVLEKYLDVYGNDNLRILRHAFLNSYFQTGLESNIDVAIINRSSKEKLNIQTDCYTKLDEIPFDFSRRMLSVIVSKDNKKQLITKGAVEEVLHICSFIDHDSVVSPLTDEVKENIFTFCQKLNSDGLRVVAIAQKNEGLDKDSFSNEDESHMVLIGFCGFLDPPKETAKESINRLNHAGIRAIVLTGDNEFVSRAICNKVNINSEKIILRK